MAKYVELRRHTDADGDVLTEDGVRAATTIGAGLHGGYDLGVSTGAGRRPRAGRRPQPTNEAAVLGLTGEPTSRGSASRPWTEA